MTTFLYKSYPVHIIFCLLGWYCIYKLSNQDNIMSQNEFKASKWAILHWLRHKLYQKDGWWLQTKLTWVFWQTGVSKSSSGHILPVNTWGHVLPDRPTYPLQICCDWLTAVTLHHLKRWNICSILTVKSQGSKMKGLHWTLLGVLCCAGIASSITREYFFAIKEIQWDYAPSGKNLIQNKTIKEDEWVQTLYKTELWVISL